MVWKSAATIGSVEASSTRRASSVLPAPAGPLRRMLGMAYVTYFRRLKLAVLGNASWKR